MHHDAPLARIQESRLTPPDEVFGTHSLIAEGEEVGRAIGQVQCRERLGGMLRYYHRAAA